MEQKSISGGWKFGYFVIGFLFSVYGILIVWLLEKEKPYFKEAFKFTIIGFVIAIVLAIIFSIIVGISIMAAVAAIVNSGDWSSFVNQGWH